MKSHEDQSMKDQTWHLIYNENFKPSYKVYRKSARYYYKKGEYDTLLIILALFFKNEPKASKPQRKWFSKKLGEMNKIFNSVYRPYKFKEMSREEIIKLSDVHKKEIINYNSPYNLKVDTILK